MPQNSDPQSLVRLGSGYTQVTMSDESRTSAIQSAYWVTMSEHEHTWSLEEQQNMARFVLWASQRLEIIAIAASSQPILHEPPPDEFSADRFNAAFIAKLNAAGPENMDAANSAADAHLRLRLLGGYVMWGQTTELYNWLIINNEDWQSDVYKMKLAQFKNRCEAREECAKSWEIMTGRVKVPTGTFTTHAL